MTWDRAIPSLVAALMPLGLMFALLGRPIGLLNEMVVFGAVIFFLARRGRRRRPDRSWSAGPSVVNASTTPRRGSVAIALAPIEVRELLLSPWFGAAVGLTVLLGAVFVTTFTRSWWAEAAVLPLAIHPLCGLVIVAVHHNVTRADRDGVRELFESCPAETSRRMGGHLLSAVAPMAVAVIWAAITLGGAGVVFHNLYGPVDERVIVDVVIAAVLLPLGATALGVLLGRWVRFALAPLAAVVAILIALLAIADRGFQSYGFLGTALLYEEVDPIFLEPPAVGRLLWITGLVVVVAGLALANGRGRPRMALVGLAVLLVGLVLTLRPLTDSTADRLAAYAAGTTSDQTCEQLAEQVELCALAPYEDHGATVVHALTPVAEALPGSPVDPPIVLQFLPSDPARLPGPVRQRLEPSDAGTVRMPFASSDKALAQARFVLAANALGVPVGGDAGVNHLVAGEARGVVLLWLGTAGLPAEVTHDILTPYSSATASEAGDVWPSEDGCRSDVQWAPQDVAAARALIAHDPEIVRGVLRENWARWLAPDTSTDELLVAVGLEPVGPADHIEPVSSC